MWQDVLTVVVDAPGAGLLRSYIVSDWRWGVLWEADDWHEVGWHPYDLGCLSLVGEWRRCLWDCLNPGKRPSRKLRRMPA